MALRGFRFIAAFILILLLVSFAGALDLRQTDIRILPSGDAEITMIYDDNPAEYLGIKAFAASPSGALEKIFGPVLTKNGNPLEIRVDCAASGTAQLTVPGFADRQGDTYWTPELSLGNEAAAALREQSGYNLDLDSDVTITFPDGYSEQQKDTSVIGSVTHTVTPGRTFDAPAQPASCKNKKDLPLSGIIPDGLEPVVAVGAGVAATGISMSLFGSSLSMWFSKLAGFIQNSVGQVLQGRLSDKEKEVRTISAETGSETILGISKRELGVIAIGAVIIGVLFIFAARIPVNPEILTIYIIMGGVALAVHEIAHWYLNKKYHATTEVQLWGMGTVIMALTAWLFGSVFAQPTLTLVYTENPLDKRSLGLIMLSGPVLSLIIAIACLCIIPLGGFLRTAGTVGFSINLLTAVFEMLPVTPCDGKVVYSWNRLVWAGIFIPLILLYFVVNL
jgi:Zn-dependent protease